MTPAISAAQKAGVLHQVHEYTHDPASESYGLEAADKLGLPHGRVFKTLVAELAGGELAVGVVPVCSMLSMKRFAKALGAKKAGMAKAADVQRSTGYVVGGVSPIGQKKRLRTVIDSSALDYPTIFVSAGRRGLEIELAGQTLLQLTSGRFEKLCQEQE
jgi:Cys-tRNA(Pro)/Cys-tRNA(Cys) deacylase